MSVRHSLGIVFYFRSNNSVLGVPQKYPDHLFIRVDRGLRVGLVEAARAANLSVSEMGRRLMRDGLSKTNDGRGAQSKGSTA